MVDKTKYFKIVASPWMTIGISLVLIAVVMSQAIFNYNREKKIMGELLSEKGAALIRSFEAGARTGMMGMMGNQANLQTLLEETASQPDIAYIFIVNKAGNILAHNDRKMIGTRFAEPDFKETLKPSDEPQWRVVDNDNDITCFEVYKTFLPRIANFPGSRMMHRMMGGMRSQKDISSWCSPGWMKDLPMSQLIDPENRPVIFIGMDVRPFNDARREDLRSSAIIIGVIFLLGLAGVVSLFWAQSYTRSRKLLQDTRAFASETISNLPMGIIVVNETSGISYINDAACSLLGVSLKTAKTISADEVLPAQVWHLRKNVNSGHGVAETEIVLQATKNKSLPINVSVTDIIGEEGNFIGYVFILKDLSELRALELEVQRKDKLAALGNLASGIAHEVRNPLSSIKGYATYFGSVFEDGSENKKAAHIMAGEVDRVDRVISELLEFARPADLKLRETDIAQFIDSSLRIIKYEAIEANVNITKQLDTPLPPLQIDPDRFSQVLLNLYINAIQSMKEGGNLSVSVTADNETVVFEISDTGKGIDAKDLTRIFNPYFTTKKRGTGLGLAIVYKIVEGHGGEIHVDSRIGEGTRFSIKMPLNQSRGN